MVGEAEEGEQEMAFPLKPGSGCRSGLSGKGPVPGVAALSILAAILVTAGPALADLSDVTSPHNFTGAGEPNIARRAGVCTPCHWMHYARDSVVRTWPRDLDDERIYFDQTSSPDYLPDSALLSSPTLLCYDCHIGVSPPVELQDPELTGWAGAPRTSLSPTAPPRAEGRQRGTTSFPTEPFRTPAIPPPPTARPREATSGRASPRELPTTPGATSFPAPCATTPTTTTAEQAQMRSCSLWKLPTGAEGLSLWETG
jgi:hypothetical protein